MKAGGADELRKISRLLFIVFLGMVSCNHVVRGLSYMQLPNEHSTDVFQTISVERFVRDMNGFRLYVGSGWEQGTFVCPAEYRGTCLTVVIYTKMILGLQT